ncbi:hypothetical protein RJ641_035654, partial [Dillenia turbinata]
FRFAIAFGKAESRERETLYFIGVTVSASVQQYPSPPEHVTQLSTPPPTPMTEAPSMDPFPEHQRDEDAGAGSGGMRISSDRNSGTHNSNAAVRLQRTRLGTWFLLFNCDGRRHFLLLLLDVQATVTVVMILPSQLPTFHSLRHINFASLLLSSGYPFLVVGACIYAGLSKKAPPRDNSLEPKEAARVFIAFTSISITAAIYGNGILPEIQATLALPATGKMAKGLMMCYGVIFITFYSAAVSGYRQLADVKQGLFSKRNLIPRIILRSIYMIICRFFAAMLPFFRDINGVVGVIGFIPLDFILTMHLYNMTTSPRNRPSHIGSTCPSLLSSQAQAFWVHFLLLGRWFLMSTSSGSLAVMWLINILFLAKAFHHVKFSPSHMNEGI